MSDEMKWFGGKDDVSEFCEVDEKVVG